MCGIVGILAAAVSERDVDPMLAMISHRGPDEFGTYLDADIALGSARLSIIDLGGGQQPILDEASGAVIVFNGEIFNYPELKDDLVKRGHRFSSQSDTEVVLRLYLEFGDQFPQFLNGQFALAIWDRSKKKLLLARDRLGIRPLFYFKEGGYLAFASEVKALLTQPTIPKALCPQAIDQIFTFWTPVGATSVFEGILELQPGSLLIVEGGKSRIETYWRWPFPSLLAGKGGTFESALEEFTDRLSRAVALQLRADVEVGSYLSGGIDSSAIVALTSKLRGGGLRTYSIGFEEASYDERVFQEMVSKYYQTNHTSVVCDYDQIEAHFEKAVWHTESPIFRTAPVPLFLLSERVRADKIKVVLTGEGADEILLGYDLFRELKIRRFWRRQPTSEARPQLFKKLYAYLPQFSNPRFAGMAIQFYRNSLECESPFYSHLVRWSNNSANKVYYSQGMRDLLRNQDPLEALTQALPPEYFEASELDRAQYLEVTTLLRGYLLASQGDRMSMANSVEGRYPFLDHEFIAFANSLPTKFKLNGLKDKYILRQSMRMALPKEVYTRPKIAYQAPEIRSFFKLKGQPSPLIERYLNKGALERVGLFDPGVVEGLLRKIGNSDLMRLGARDNMALVQMLSCQILHRLLIVDDIGKTGREKAKDLAIRTRIRYK